MDFIYCLNKNPRLYNIIQLVLGCVSKLYNGFTGPGLSLV